MPDPSCRGMKKTSKREIHPSLGRGSMTCRPETIHWVSQIFGSLPQESAQPAAPKHCMKAPERWRKEGRVDIDLPQILRSYHLSAKVLCKPSVLLPKILRSFAVFPQFHLPFTPFPRSIISPSTCSVIFTRTWPSSPQNRFHCPTDCMRRIFR